MTCLSPPIILLYHVRRKTVLFSIAYPVQTLREMLGIGEEKSLFIGQEYGYTGTSSPLIALYESIERGIVKRGDYVMFWTIGAGSQNIALLFKY